MNGEKQISSYAIVIRTLGTGGDKYKNLIDSISKQTCPPKYLLIFIADGYQLPQYRLGIEKYIYTRKGMWHQRVYGLEYASNLSDVDYILALDDDLSFECDFAEQSLEWMENNNCDVLINDLKRLNIQNTKSSFRDYARDICYAIIGNRLEWYFQSAKIKIMSTGGFRVKTKYTNDAMPTESGQFAAFWIKASEVSKLALGDENWLDSTRYALPDDQVFFYKSYLLGLNQYIHGGITVYHLDHGSSDPNRMVYSAYANGRNFLIFWHRFLYVRSNFLKKIMLTISIIYRIFMNSIFFLINSVIKKDMNIFKSYVSGVKDGMSFIKSLGYKSLGVVLSK